MITKKFARTGKENVQADGKELYKKTFCSKPEKVNEKK